MAEAAAQFAKSSRTSVRHLRQFFDSLTRQRGDGIAPKGERWLIVMSNGNFPRTGAPANDFPGGSPSNPMTSIFPENEKLGHAVVDGTARCGPLVHKGKAHELIVDSEKQRFAPVI